MKKNESKSLRQRVQLFLALALIAIIILYNLYINEILNFKILSIADLNPYGGWNALREYVTDSSYEFEGINKSIALTIAILAIAVLGGRFFCGWLCPLGAIQDLGSWLSSKIKVSKHVKIDKKGYNPFFIKYPILLSLLLISILGYGAVIAELSPWRALLNLPRLFSAWAEMKIGFIILAFVFLASMFLPRFFCRYLCPLGAAQSLFSSLSLTSLKHSKTCPSCNKCLEECPVGLKFSKESDRISPECIRCLNCVEQCKITDESRVYLSLFNKKVTKISYFVLMLIIFAALWIGMPKLWVGNSYGNNILLGTLKDGTYQGEAKGFAGKIITKIIVEDGKITEIEIIDHHESKGWYDEVFMVIPKEIIRKQSLEVDAISGATKTSKGLINSLGNAVKKAVGTK